MGNCLKRSDRSNVPSSISSKEERNNRKSLKSEQSDGDDTNNKKNKIRYLIRSGKTDSEDKTDHIINEEDNVEKWNFPPILDEFNLMELDVDPSSVEDMFKDTRLVQVIVRLSSDQGLGLSIVGGKDSPNGEAPIYIKRILGDSVLQKDGKLKSGDELVAVNDTLLVNVTKEYASQVLSNVQGVVRILAIQDL